MAKRHLRYTNAGKEGQAAAFRPGDRVIGYFRDSGGDDQDRSIAEQQAEWQQHCEREGLVPFKQFADQAQTGRSTKRRRAFREMVEYFSEGQAAKEEVRGLLIWSFNRLARQETDSSYYISLIRRAGYLVKSITDKIPEGDFASIFEALTFFKDAQFSRDLSKHVQRGQSHLLNNYRQDGGLYELPDGRQVQLSGGGFPPVGYEKHQVQTGENRRGTPRFNSYWQKTTDPDLAGRVRLAWEMFLGGTSYSEIETACHLGRSDAGYNDMFQTVTYTGVYSYGAFTRENAFEAYVSKEEYQRAQEILEERVARLRLIKKPKAYRYLLSGMLVCGTCHSPMHGVRLVSGNKKFQSFYYQCSSRDLPSSPCPAGRFKVKAGLVEGQVLQALIAQVLLPEKLEAMAKKLAEKEETGPAELAPRLEELEETISSQTDRIQRLITKLAELEDLGVGDDVNALIAQARRKRDLAKAEIEKLRGAAWQKDLAFYKFNRQLLEQARWLLADLYAEGAPSGRYSEEDERYEAARDLLAALKLEAKVSYEDAASGRVDIKLDLAVLCRPADGDPGGGGPPKATNKKDRGKVLDFPGQVVPYRSDPPGPNLENFRVELRESYPILHAPGCVREWGTTLDPVPLPAGRRRWTRK
jgi:site-specific DNA recombinase